MVVLQRGHRSAPTQLPAAGCTRRHLRVWAAPPACLTPTTAPAPRCVTQITYCGTGHAWPLHQLLFVYQHAA